MTIDRSEKSNFSSASKATFDIGRDNAAGKENYKIVGDIGYHIPLSNSGAGSQWNLIPYVGMNYNVINVDTGSTAKPSVNKTVDFGTILSLDPKCKIKSTIIGNLITIQPDYLFDVIKNSQLVTGNLMYTPIINDMINSFIQIGTNILSIKGILNIKDDNGIYTNKGNSSVSGSNKNYVRLGGQFGASILSDNEYLPLSLTSTYTRLHPVVGVSEIHYFSNSISYSFDPNKYFGISFTYSKGTREDTAASENQWDAALSARF